MLGLFKVPETKGLTLEEMDDVFGDANGSSAADLERIAAIHKRIGLTAYAGGEDHGSRGSAEKMGSDLKA